MDNNLNLLKFQQTQSNIYYAYGQPLNQQLKKKKRKKRTTILDNPIPILQQQQYMQMQLLQQQQIKQQQNQQRDAERQQAQQRQYNQTMLNFNEQNTGNQNNPRSINELELNNIESSLQDINDKDKHSSLTTLNPQVTSSFHQKNSGFNGQQKFISKKTKFQNQGNHNNNNGTYQPQQQLPSIHSLISTTSSAISQHNNTAYGTGFKTLKNPQINKRKNLTQIESKSSNSYEQRIEQLLREQKLLKSKASQYYSQNSNSQMQNVIGSTIQKQKTLQNGSLYGVDQFVRGSVKIRDKSSEGRGLIDQSNLLNMSDLGNLKLESKSLQNTQDKQSGKITSQNGQLYNKNNPNSHSIEQYDIEENSEHLEQTSMNSNSQLQNSQYQNLRSTQHPRLQNQDQYQYKLPSIRSNDSITHQEEQQQQYNSMLQNHRFSSNQQQQKKSLNNNMSSQLYLQNTNNMSLIEESKNLLLIANQQKNYTNKFIGISNQTGGSNRTQILKEFNGLGENQTTNPQTFSYRNTNVNFYERNSMIKQQNSTPSGQSTAGSKKIKIVNNQVNSRQEEPQLTITEEEKQIYGNRFPQSYKKVKLLGRGGCALVWLGKDEKNGDQLVAVKQFPKSSSQISNLESGYKELSINRKFFQSKGVPFEAYSSNPGINYLCKLLDNKEDKQDLWLIFELCGKPLSKSLFEVKGEFYKGERIYQVLHREELFRLFQQNSSLIFKDFIKSMAQVLYLFQSAGIVHSDLKSENILILHDRTTNTVSYKIIDLGSSFNFQKSSQEVELTTPEYLAPDLLEYLDSKSANLASGSIDLSKKLFPWSIDIWSLGAILLEMVSGFPLWLSYKGRIVKESLRNSMNQSQTPQSSACMTGLFGIQGRIPKKIKQKQIQTVQNLKQTLKKQFQSELCLGSLNTNELFLDLLSKMMELNPKLRISPKEVLEHSFLISD
eukprot:403351053